jgi:hypothetical protein
MPEAEKIALAIASEMIMRCREALEDQGYEFTTGDCIAMAALAFRLSETQDVKMAGLQRSEESPQR